LLSLFSQQHSSCDYFCLKEGKKTGRIMEGKRTEQYYIEHKSQSVEVVSKGRAFAGSQCGQEVVY